jgi:hypothetical protein
MVKVDVEGHELALLAGATQTLSSRTVGFWLIELEFRQSGSAIFEALATLKAEGYRGWALLPGLLIPTELFSVARHQSSGDQTTVQGGGKRPPSYANNFLFARRDLVSAVVSAAENQGWSEFSA